jgi:plasmid stability protein
MFMCYIVSKVGDLDMSNLTISVDDKLIKQARVRAIQQGTSLSAKVREFLQYYVNESEEMLQTRREEATARLMLAIESATSQTQPEAKDTVLGLEQRQTLRDELYAGDFRARDQFAVKTE